jgi:hypothetical protein
MKLRVLILCTLAALSACQRDADGKFTIKKPAVKAKAPVAPVAGPTAQEQTATMVEAATQGKSLAPISLKFDVLERPTPGQPLEIAIALLPQAAASPVTVDVTGPENLPLAAAESHFEFPEVDAAQVYRHNIKLTPATEGVYLLTLSVSMKRDQLADSRVFSVPLIVASGAAAPAPAPASAPAAPPQSAAGSPQAKGAPP